MRYKFTSISYRKLGQIVSSNNTAWQFFPRSVACPDHLNRVVEVFEKNSGLISSDAHTGQTSNEVLGHLRKGFERLGFEVESSKSASGKIQVPVLYGPNGIIEKYFDADAYSKDLKTVMEVEAGRAVTNYQFLKDLFQACVMQEVDYLVIAVRKDYRGSSDFSKVVKFFETLYVSDKFRLPLLGVLIVGY